MCKLPVYLVCKNKTYSIDGKYIQNTNTHAIFALKLRPAPHLGHCIGGNKILPNPFIGEGRFRILGWKRDRGLESWRGQGGGGKFAAGT